MYMCDRCNGTGKMVVYSHVLGGVCFKCGGKGEVRTKPSAPSVKWAVFGPHKATGVMLRLYNVTASTQAQALAKAASTYEKASAAWRETYGLDGAQAIKWSALKDQQATTLKEALPS